MATMTVVEGLPPMGQWRHADLERLPDDGNRYELIDGCLIVTPAPAFRHQLVVSRLIRLLAQGMPAGIEVLTAPVDVRLADDTVVQPDLIVVPRIWVDGQFLDIPPLLAVEVRSRSTAMIDRNVKFARYERAGVPSYWIVDPDEPRLTAWELRGPAGRARYVEVTDVGGEESWAATLPFPVTITPARLTD